MKKYLLLVLLLPLFSMQLIAQEITLSGVIKDSIGEPLELANIIASVKESGDVESYAITNYEGRFRLDLPVGNTYILKASYLGLESKEIEIIVPADSDDITQDINLMPLTNELEGVEIIYEMPVTVRGDTIVYNADSFTTGNERKLEDVIKKLPGLEINEDGEIEVEGKVVSKVMVEGKDFFDGDSKMATKNIPADAVDKVEVLRNYNEVNQMRGLGNDQDNIAINIKLKEGKKNFWFGEITAGIGIDSDENERYLVHPKLFYYNPDYSINIITDFNDIGEVPFTFRDYFRFTGGFRNFNRGGGTNFSVSSNDLGFSLGQDNRANKIETKFLAGNFSWAATPKWDLSGFAILSDNRTNFITNSIRSFIESRQVETTSSNSDQRSQLGMLKLSSVYKPNSNFQLDYDALIKTSKQTEDDTTLSIVDSRNNEISEALESKPFSINQNVNMYYTLNDKNIFAGKIQHLYQDENPFYNVIQDSIPFRGIFTGIDITNPFDSSFDTFDPIQQSTRYNVNQDKNIETNKIDAKIDYYYVINNKSNINFTLGSTYSNQKFNSTIFQILDSSSENPFTDNDFNNDVEFDFTDIFLGVHYKFKTGIFTFTPGVTLHNYNVKNKQLGSSTTKNDWLALPDFNAIIALKKSENIRLNYSISAQYTDINNFAEGYVFNNYNRLFRGNRNLENSFAHSYSVNYFSFNMFNYTNVSGSVNYTRRIDAIKSDTDIAGITQVSSPVNLSSNFADETLSIFGRFSKRIKRVQIKLGARVNWSSFNNIVNDNISESISLTQSYNASVQTSFKEWPNLEVGYRLTINDYDNGGLESTFYTNQPFVKLDYSFLKNFTIVADWDYYDYTNDAKTIQNTYSFLDAKLYYQKQDSKWEYSIQATNILDTDLINNDSFNETFNSSSSYFVLPRIVMFVVKYDI